jgi:hypothetical protein
MDDLDTVTLHVDPSSVYLLRFLLEGYDNLFLMSTIDHIAGTVEIRVAEGACEDLWRILESVTDNLGLDPR